MNKWKAHLNDCKDIRNELLLGEKGILRNNPSHMMRSKPYLDKSPKVSISKLNKIIELSPEKKVIIVEPYVTQGQIVDATLPFGLIPPVIAEFEKITVGGAINGSSLESSSFKFGQFNDTCLKYGVLLGNGSMVRGSSSENPDLFYGVSGSFGTLGLLMNIEIPLIPAKKYVDITVKAFTSIDDFFKVMEKFFMANDFVEGIIFNRNHACLITGQFSDKPSYPLFSPEYSSPWFYEWAEKNCRFSMGLKDYLFRHNRGAFWMGSYLRYPWLVLRLCTNDKIPFFKNNGKYNNVKPLNPVIKSMLGKKLDAHALYKWLHSKREGWFKKNVIVQDFYLPKEKSAQFTNYALDLTEITPIWICPCKGASNDQFLSPHANGNLFYDIGIYGWPSNTQSAEEATKKLEAKTYELGGRKMLYSYNFMDEKFIHDHYDMEKYERLREKFYAAPFPSFTDKIS